MIKGRGGPAFILMVSIFLIVSGIPLLERISGEGPDLGSLDEEGNIETVWDSEFEGNISQWKTTSSGIEKISVGHADGNGNYYIRGYEVQANETLIIRAGVSIFFEKYFTNQFEVFGSLKIEGSQNNMVSFQVNISNDDHWEGIYIYDGADKIEINYCHFVDGWFNVCKREIELNNCIFERSGLKVLNVERDISEVIVQECEFIGESKNIYVFLNIENLEMNACDFNDCSFDYIRFENIETLNFFENKFQCDVDYLSFEKVDHFSIYQNTIDIPKSIIIYSEIGGNNIVSENDITCSKITLAQEDMIVTDNSFDCIVDIHAPMKITDNIIDEGLIFNTEIGTFENNVIGTISYMDYYRIDDEPIEIDISHNQWDTDEYPRSLLRIDDLEEDDIVIFEPYYDRNGVLTDNDGIPNSWEEKYGLDIYEDNSETDTDGDGMTDLEEFLYDSGYESLELDPTDPDYDDDGMPDGWEISHDLNPFESNGQFDDDEDGFTNLEEYEMNTDPMDPLDPYITEDDDQKQYFIFFIGIAIIIVLVLFSIFFIRTRLRKRDHGIVHVEDVEVLENTRPPID